MNIFKKLVAKIFFVAALVLTFTAQSHAGDVVNLQLGVHGAEVLNLPKEMTEVVIADRSVAGVVKHTPTKVSIVGNRIGKTDIRFMNGKRIVRQVNVTVRQDLQSIKHSLSSLFPAESVGVEMVNDTVALQGSVSDSETAAQIEKVAQQYVGDGQVLNLMKLKSGQQVMLRVRVGEIRRDALNKLGLGIHGIISGGSAVLGALEHDGVFKILAEPTLTAISGESAKFLAGGEIPVPVMQSGNTMSVDYKPVGVSVSFKPLVLSENRIRLDVSSEVSEVSATKINVNQIAIPSISTRRANTTVELSSGESFMIAGLIKDDSAANIYKVPGLGDIPILSPLFRSVDFQRHETELVIAVTPYLADPVSGDQIRMPTDSFKHSSMLEMLFLGNLGAKNIAPENGLEGPVGYLID